jgi:hypothetical protein
MAGVAVLAASLAIPLVASANAKRPAVTKVHCSAKHDNVVDVSQFVEDKFSGTASSQTCTVTLSGSYTPNKIIAPVTVTTTTKVTAGSAGAPGGFTGQIKNKLFNGSFTGQLTNPKGTNPGTYKVKVTIGVDVKPLTFIIVISW